MENAVKYKKGVIFIFIIQVAIYLYASHKLAIY